MNIHDSIGFKPDKPAVLQILKTEKLHYFAVGLLEGQALKAHKTAVPALLTVLKGRLDFKLEGETIHLNSFDILSIPVDKLHEVVGLEAENIFTLLK